MADEVRIVPLASLKEREEYERLFDPMDRASLLRLRDDIAEHGIHVPIEVNDRMEVLDGYQRCMAATMAGVEDVSVVVRTFQSRDEEKLHAIRLNVLRRHLKPGDLLRVQHQIEAMLTEGKRVVGKRGGRPKKTLNGGEGTITQAEVNRGVAEATGVTPRQVQRRRETATPGRGFQNVPTPPKVRPRKQIDAIVLQVLDGLRAVSLSPINLPLLTEDVRQRVRDEGTKALEAMHLILSEVGVS